MFQYRLFVLFIFIPASLQQQQPASPGLQPIDRNCCRYRCAEQGNCAAWCTDQNTCIIKNSSASALIADGGCSVIYDTKVDQSSIKSKEDCLKKKFTSRKSFDELPFYVDPYVFKSSSRSHSPFIGIDLKYRYNMFHKLRFRFKNMNPNVCPEDLSLDEKSPCNPRCVEIDKSESQPAYGLQQNINLFSYDCEVGFYIHEDKYVISSRDDYRLSICSIHHGVNTCGQFSFQMPSIKDLKEDRVLILLDRQEFERRDKIVIHVPTTQNPDSFHVSILRLNEDAKSTVFTQIVPVHQGEHNPMRIKLNHNIPSGRYQVAVIPLRGGNRTALPSYSAMLERPDYGQHTLLIITIILFTVIIVGIILVGYKRKQRIVEGSRIEPNIQIKAGLLHAKSVFIITQLENSDHTQVVKELCVYLRTQCGIADTFFPLDDEGGVHAAGSGSGDPWKWAQKSYEKVKESGAVLFIAGPNKHYAQVSSLWPGIQENQMFLVEPDLISLYRQGRLLVLSFPYSDLKTLPSSLPKHVVQDTRIIPKDLNSILLQILKVDPSVCSCCGSCICADPEILPANLTNRTQGTNLADKINILTTKVQKTGEEKQDNSNSIFHRILKREVKRNKKRNVGGSSVAMRVNNMEKTSPLATNSPLANNLSSETDKLLKDEKEVVPSLKGESIQTSLNKYIEMKEESTTGSEIMLTPPGGHTLMTSPGGQSCTTATGDQLLFDGSCLPATASNPTEEESSTTIHVELEQNLPSIKSLMNRDKTEIEDV